jgi:hypothetical protein
MIPHFSLQHFRFYLERKSTLQMPACLLEHRQAYNKGSTLTLRHAQGHSERSRSMRLRP